MKRTILGGLAAHVLGAALAATGGLILRREN